MMKKLLMIALVMTLGLGWSMAQNKKVENVKTTVFATDIHCENCSTKIMNNVPALGKGIKDVVVNVESQTVAVTYDASKNSDENITKGFRSLSVNAQPAVKQDCCGKKDCADKKDCDAAKHECAEKKDCAAAKHECAEKKDCAAAKHECADKKDCDAAKHECADKKDCDAAKHECADKKDCDAAKHECNKEAPAKKDCCKDK